MDVSLIIVTRNTCEQTTRAILSILDSLDTLSKEIILVDNGSTDATPRVIPSKFPTIKYLRQECNLGFAAANNLGAREANGDFIVLLNSDARLQPDALGTAIHWIRAHPECGIAGAQLLNPNGSRQNSIANFPTLATELLNKSLLRHLFPKRFPGKKCQFVKPIEVESVIGAFMLIRSDLWKALGGLDESYFFFFEETDLCVRASREGWKVCHLPQVQVWHEQGQSAKQMPSAARIEYWRSRYIFFRRHHGRLSQAALAVGLVLRLVVDWLATVLVLLLFLGTQPRWRNKLRTQTALLKWFLLGRPAGVGLPR